MTLRRAGSEPGRAPTCCHLLYRSIHLRLLPSCIACGTHGRACGARVPITRVRGAATPPAALGSFVSPVRISAAIVFARGIGRFRG